MSQKTDEDETKRDQQSQRLVDDVSVDTGNREPVPEPDIPQGSDLHDAFPPPPAEAFDLRVGAPAPPPPDPPKLPTNFSPEEKRAYEIVSAELRRLESWAKLNLREAKSKQMLGWALKVPAIVCAAGTAGLEALDLGSAVIWAGMISAVCTALDGLFANPRVQQACLEASYEIRAEQAAASQQLAAACLERKLVSAVPGILEELRKSERRITDQLKAANAGTALPGSS
ncbi:MAG: hypothetical protein Q8S73_33195 [Deltaproteobacteria bacterium]|nr:hypothetical protein [Deltaproteobacteria bacterium]